MIRVFTLLLSLLFFTSAALAVDYASVDDAKAMAIKAAEFLKTNGPENSFAAFQAKQ